MKSWFSRETASFLGLGLEIAGPILIGIFLGWQSDKKWHTTPWGVLLGTALGLAVGFYRLFQAVSDIEKEDENSNQK